MISTVSMSWTTGRDIFSESFDLQLSDFDVKSLFIQSIFIFLLLSVSLQKGCFLYCCCLYVDGFPVLIFVWKKTHSSVNLGQQVREKLK